MELNSVSVGVEDMDRAVEFYRELLEMEPTQHEERYSIFEFDTVRFGLYDAGNDGFDLERGNNCIPNFEVSDIDAARSRIETIAPELVHDDVLAFGAYRTFHFIDSEGNETEVFSIEAA